MDKTRRTFTPEFKAQAVKLITEQGKSLAEVALDLGESMLRAWEQALAKRGSPGSMAGPADVPGPARLRRRLLRLAGKAAEPYGGQARRPGRRDQGRPWRGQGPLRQPADPRRAGRAGDALLRQHRGEADARARDRCQDPAEVPLYDRLEPRPPSGRECAGSSVRAGGPESGLDCRY